MGSRFARRMRRREPPCVPRYGDAIMIPSEHPDGHWCNGIVNSGLPGGANHSGGRMLVAAPGHAKSNLVLIPVNGYRVHWCYPSDVGAKGSAAKAQALSDVEG